MESVFGIFVALIFFYVLLEWRLGRARRESEQRYADLEAKTRWLYKMLDELQAAPPKTAEAPVAEAAPAVEMRTSEPQAEPVAVPQRLTFADSPAEAAAVEPPAPKEPGWLAKLLFGGNILAKIGVVLLIFGVGSALKLAAEFGVLPAEARLGIAALFGVALGVLGWRKRAGHEMFGFALQGGGVAVLYLVVYFALTRYALIGTTAAFACFVLLGIGGMLLAAVQDGRSLAVLGLIGAFLAPILASSDTGNHVVLFSYFTLLNLFIFGLSWFRSWRSLNVAGFLLTFAIGVNWGLKFYRPEYFDTTEPFLVVLFLIYSLIPIVFALRAAPGTAAVDRIDSHADLRHAGGVRLPAGAAGRALRIRPRLVGGHRGAVLPCARLHRRQPQAGGTVGAGGKPALGGGGAADAGRAFRLRRARDGGAVGAGRRGGGVDGREARTRAHRAGRPGAANRRRRLFPAAHRRTEACDRTRQRCLRRRHAGGHCRIDRELCRQPPESEGVAAAPVGRDAGLERAVALRHGPQRDRCLRRAALALRRFAGAGRPAAGGGGVRRQSGSTGSMLRRAALLLPLVLAGGAVAVLDLKRHPFADAAWISWLLAYAGHFIVLSARRRMRESLARRAACAGLLRARRTLRLGSQLATEGTVAGNSPGTHARLGRRAGRAARRRALRGTCASLAASDESGRLPEPGRSPGGAGAGAWTLVLNFDYSGAAGGWRYVPVFSLLDLGQALVLAVLFAWVREQSRAKGLLYAVLGGLTFAWVSAGAARTVHHWLGVPFVWDRLVDSVALQASWSILWTLLALGLMIQATRRGLRTLWFAGFGLLGVVGLKLMLVDTAHVNTLGRTVSLLGVALLVIAASYFAPTPPKSLRKG
jgi:hypothetical protein